MTTRETGEIMVLISPSILAADPGKLADAVVLADRGGADWIHLDIMDGHFVPNLTYGPAIVKALRGLTELPFDAHLMVTNPDELIPQFLEIGCQYIAVHQEACIHLHRTISMIRDGGCKAGVSLNPATPIEMVLEILPELDFVVIMGVNPGFAGQKHIPGTAEKVSRLSGIARDRDWEGLIQIDGGVSPENVASLVLAGADCLVAGAGAFRRRKKGEIGFDSDYAEQVKLNIEDLRQSI